ncbi:BLUF domain-containing protein [Henriciella aquimarina]|uniref:BLUF domain-containing protein n=1 Tax=Henriciella aquimarina TaxID=545261 RepID=UPI000A03B916|nr:BLUF domain-containing protein [Henriciella aquimarina]
MYRLAYVSAAAEELTATDLQDILEAAIRNNAASAITGTLMFNGVSFLQILEGPEEKVEALFDRICDDSRHRHIVTIMRESGTRRSFDESPMTLNTVECPVAPLPDGITLSSDLSLFLPAGLPDYYRNILVSFNTMRA